MALHLYLNISVPPGNIKERERFRCAKVVQKKTPHGPETMRRMSGSAVFRLFFRLDRGLRGGKTRNRNPERAA